MLDSHCDQLIQFEMAQMASSSSSQDALSVEQLSKGTVFSDYSSFEAAWKAYCQDKFVFSKRRSRTINNVNKTIKNESNHYPQSWQYFSLRLDCKHYGNYETKSSGIHTNLNTYKTGCSAFITLQGNKEKGGLMITDVNLKHSNHDVNVGHVYPEQRRLQGEHQEHLKYLLKLKVPHAAIQEEFLSKHGIVVEEQDIRNFKKSISSSNKTTDEEDLWHQVNQLVENGGDCEIITDSTGCASVIFIQTLHMKEDWVKFPEVLFLDSTYKVNNKSMPLFCFVVCDGDNKGRIAAYAVVRDERAVTVQSLLELFFVKNSSGNLKTIVVDKDFSEIAAIRNLLPAVSICLCRFHVDQAFQRRLTGHTDREVILNILRGIMRCTSEIDYQIHLNRLEASATVDFMSYFNSHWKSIENYWVGCYIQDITHFGNVTNNMVESHHQKLKKHLSHVTSVSKMVQTLVNLHQRSVSNRNRDSKKLALKKRQVVVPNSCPSDVIEAICNSTTLYAANILKNELSLCFTRNLADFVVIADALYQVTDSGKVYVINDSNCSCHTSLNCRLTCRHLFAVRQCLKESLFQTGTLPQKFLLNAAGAEQDAKKKQCVNVVKQGSTNPPRALSKHDKFLKMKKVSLEIADVASMADMSKFDEIYGTVSALLEMLRDGHRVGLCDLDSDNINNQVLGTVQVELPSTSTSQTEDSLNQGGIPERVCDNFRGQPNSSDNEVPSTSLITTDSYTSSQSAIAVGVTDNLEDIVEEDQPIETSSSAGARDSTLKDFVPFHLPKKVVCKGRPKQKRQASTSKKGKGKKMKLDRGHESMFEDIDANFVLSKILSAEDLNRVFDFKQLVTREMVQITPELIRLIESFTIDRFKKFFDEDSWTVFEQYRQSMQEKINI